MVEFTGNLADYTQFPVLRESLAPWTELYRDLAEKIGRQLMTTNLADYIRFRAVCKSWRSATSDPRDVYLPPQLPWIMLSFHDQPYFVAPPRLAWSTPMVSSSSSDDTVKDVNDMKSFSSAVSCRDTLEVYNEQPLPFPRPTRILGTDAGWLVVMDITLSIYLFNPLTHKRKCLPPLTMKLFKPRVVDDAEGDDDDDDDDECHDQDTTLGEDPHPQSRQLQKYLLSKVIRMPDRTAVADVLTLKRLVFARPGGEKERWERMDVPFKFTDIISYQGAVYGVDSDGVVARCEIGPPATITQVTTKHGYRDWWYLVESLSGVLLLVAHSTTEFTFQVFRLDQKEGKLIEVKSLGDQMLFLNTNRSYCLYASDFPGWDANRIYVTPFSYYLPAGRSSPIQCDYFFVYNLEDGSCSGLHLNQGGPDHQTFTWFTPGVY